MVSKLDKSRTLDLISLVIAICVLIATAYHMLINELSIRKVALAILCLISIITISKGLKKGRNK